jgi:3-oxoacyl-[acyl-carrier-protein] synthase-3
MIGIRGLGMYAPPTVRTNDWWPREVVQTWPRPASPPTAELTAGMQHVLDGVASVAGDPFQGVVERRVLDDTTPLGDMELHAAREAMAEANVAPGSIGLLLTHTVVTPHQLVNPACELHEQLGLARECLALEVEATGYTVLAQLALAESMIAAGRVDHALLVQACVGSQLVEPTHPFSVLGGDAATAIVVGRVGPQRGLRSFAHFTDGRYPRSLVLAYRDGRKQLVAEPAELWTAQIQTADVCKHAVDVALQRAGYTVPEIDFLCAFQGTAWLHHAIAAHLGAQGAKSSDVFRRFGYLSAAALTASLYIGVRERRLVRDDLVVLTGGGTGMTYGAAVLRWGNA